MKKCEYCRSSYYDSELKIKCNIINLEKREEECQIAIGNMLNVKNSIVAPEKCEYCKKSRLIDGKIVCYGSTFISKGEQECLEAIQNMIKVKSSEVLFDNKEESE